MYRNLIREKYDEVDGEDTKLRDAIIKLDLLPVFLNFSITGVKLSTLFKHGAYEIADHLINSDNYKYRSKHLDEIIKAKSIKMFKSIYVHIKNKQEVFERVLNLDMRNFVEEFIIRGFSPKSVKVDFKQSYAYASCDYLLKQGIEIEFKGYADLSIVGRYYETLLLALIDQNLIHLKDDTFSYLFDVGADTNLKHLYAAGFVSSACIRRAGFFFF